MTKGVERPKYVLGLLLVAFLIFTILISVRLTQQKQILEPRAAPKDSSAVELLTSDRKFNRKKTTILDFSQVSCCRILGNEYVNSAGVEFENNISSGWATYQANEFANHLSSSPQPPGAPSGTTGTRFTFSKATKRAGMYIQSGSPFDLNSDRPAKSISLKAYDVKGNKIFEQDINTCLGISSSCKPTFIGVQSRRPIISTLELIINDTYNWSIDDLKWEF